ncbi:MAG: TonB-dependent receptor [Chitinophagales bacterium]|nr:TonB-dependent receptor [Chitinophagales bacterium]
MKKLLFVFSVIVIGTLTAQGQNVFTAQIFDKEENEALEGAVVLIDKTELLAYSDSAGFVRLEGIPDGEQIVIVSMVGYFRKKLKLTFPLSTITVYKVQLEPQQEELEEVVIVTTRNYQKAENLPIRVDVVANEEMMERSIDKPSSISHAVKEQPGVQVQRTSASSGLFNIRLQGLNGKYTQLMKDGLPFFGGLSNALGIAQIPPMDLKQIEIIKGPASVLYGGDAIAGVVNLISREPEEEGVYDVLFNMESTFSVDAGAYLSQRFKHVGFSVMGLYRNQPPKDWNADNFTDYPKLERYTVAPQLHFYINERARLNVGVMYAGEKRLGGTMQYTMGKQDSVYNYFERNNSTHFGSNFRFEYDFEKAGTLRLKNAVNFFDRSLQLPFYSFGGKQLASLTELNYHLPIKKHDVVLGLDFRTDKFSEDKKEDSTWRNRSYNLLTAGLFLQYTYHINEKSAVSGGVRFDYNNVYKVNVLPHVAVLHKWTKHFSSRLNAGMGYKLPTVFQEDSEERNFKNVLPVGVGVKPELSAGGTLDFVVTIPNINGLSLTVSQMLFYTHLFRPVMSDTGHLDNCSGADCDAIYYRNMNGFANSRGFETGLRLSYRGFQFGVNYTLIDHNRNINGVKSIAELTAKHQLALMAGCELFKILSLSVDAYYFSPQKLSTGSTTRSIWELGINTQLNFKYVVLFANAENILNIRQTSYGPVVTPNPDYSHPLFSEVYGPLEGTIVNGGFKLRLGELLKLRKNKASKHDDDD